MKKNIQKQLEKLPSDKKLKVATIFSYASNEEEPDGTIDEILKLLNKYILNFNKY